MSSDNVQDVDISPELDISCPSPGLSSIATGDAVHTAESSTTAKSTAAAKSSERQIKYERAQKCLENAALVTKRIKEHRKATAELLGRPFEDDPGDTASELASNVSERTGYSVATDTSTLSVQEALNSISESLANTLKQKEVLMEKIKQYKEITKKPMIKKTTTTLKRAPSTDISVEAGKQLTGDTSNLQNLLKDKENAISVMQVKLKAMETTIMDLQEKLGERDMIIDAKTKATSLMSDNLNRKEKDSMILLEDTRQQMTKMQENFVAMEMEWKDEKAMLIKQLQEREDRVKHLEEANTILENSRFEISVEHSRVMKDLEEKNKEILDLQNKLDELAKNPKSDDAYEQEKGSIEISNMVELSKRIELLEQINCQIRQTNKELENKLSSAEPKPLGTSPKKSNQPSPLPSRKGRSTASKAKSPWSNISEPTILDTDKKQNKGDIAKLEVMVQSLNKEIIDKEFSISQKDERISQLESLISEKEILLQQVKNQIEKENSNTSLITAECYAQTDVVDNSNFVTYEKQETDVAQTSLPDDTELETKLNEAQQQVAQLTEEIDAANKNMIKVKASHKLKLKQMQKTIDNFSKVSDANAEVTKLNEEIHQLTQKVAELEEEKGNLQLHLVDYDSGRLTESDTYKKLVEVESLAESRLNAISALETQKFDLAQELHLLQQKNEEIEDKLTDMSNLQSEHVCSEIQTVQLEEQLDALSAQKTELELIRENLILDKEQMSSLIKKLEAEKDELTNKLDTLIQENIDLTDKLGKLSAEKVSSAESIEIVESLTSEQKLEIEEYNKRVIADKQQEHEDEGGISKREFEETLQKYLEESSELNKKIELFAIEREEVMEKMNAINTENELLQNQILQLSGKTGKLQDDIIILSKEKEYLSSLNDDLNNQINQLKHEKVEILKEAATLNKASIIEDTSEIVASELQSDEKSSNEKGAKGAKTVKQLTKDILKLKNIIKEREAEIGDCQMKILSLEEQQQRHVNIVEGNETYEAKIKALVDENKLLAEELNLIKQNKVSEVKLNEEMNELKQNNEKLILELNTIHNEYNTTIQFRDTKINELENVLSDYEKQIHNFNDTIQMKDKELSDYLNQVTKLNDVLKKLKSTIDCLEEEKARDQNAELVKSFNKQITLYQKTLKDYEDNLSMMEEEKSKLLSIKSMLENKYSTIESEIKMLQETLLEKQKNIQDLLLEQQRHSDDILAVKTQVKERDEEIHEIKLQLRKESIENEKLRNELVEKDKLLEIESHKVEQITGQLRDDNTAIKTELMEKLKKYALALKKKHAMCTDLEAQLDEAKKAVTSKNEELVNNSRNIEEVTTLQTRIVDLERELTVRNAEIVTEKENKSNEMKGLTREKERLQSAVSTARNELKLMSDKVNALTEDLDLCMLENSELRTVNSKLGDKLTSLEQILSHMTNLESQVTALERDVLQRDNHITLMTNQAQMMEENYKQMMYGIEAKIQERDLYVENLETEISKYKSRIARLEESISVMEDRRHSLERKADQLDVQLQEKFKAYSEYSTQEDELINRLVVLMDHDRVVEKQLHEIEKDNKDLQIKIHDVNEENIKLKKLISDLQNEYDIVVDKANKADSLEVELNANQEKNRELENFIKKITSEHHNIIMSKKKDIEDIETEFNTQIENTLKEKKTLLEKYEKMNEHVLLLEQKINEYKITNKDLNVNLEEASRLNQELYEKLSTENSIPKTDYTDQYIEEINKLNAMINLKNQEFADLNENYKKVQININQIATNKQAEIDVLKNEIESSVSNNLKQFVEELEKLRSENVTLKQELYDSSEREKYLMEKKTMTFEMNIPKTEGMIISSTIEQLCGAPPLESIDLASIESQIVGETTDSTSLQENKSKQLQEGKVENDKLTEDKPELIETKIIPQKAYLCYKNTEDDTHESIDPFNSDDGWGFEDNGATSGQLMADFSQLNKQILDLKKTNEKLQTDLNASNTKLLKAMKKLKEVKANNDVLTNELKLSKHLAQPTFLDSTLEDELRVQVQNLNKSIDELNTKLNSESRDNDTLRKHNDQLTSTNTKLLNQKEKLESEIEMWKYNFREANEKAASMQWESDTKQEAIIVKTDVSPNKDEIIKLENENDDLQNEIDDLTKQNQELTLTLAKFRDEVTYLKDRSNKELQCNNCIKLQELKLQLESEILKLKAEIDLYVSKVEQISKDSENTRQELVEKLKKYERECSVSNNDIQMALLTDELASRNVHKTEPNWEDSRTTKDDLKKYVSLNAELLESLSEANNIKLLLENDKEYLSQKLENYELQIEGMNEKIKKLNNENDQLLSTVAELRNSVSTAVDQRGYEIAEMWKQHLSQRENDFSQIEKDLRDQLNATELKYEQLLDSVQSSSQEETSKLVMVEQCNALQNKLQDKEEHLVNMQNKCTELINQIEMLRSESDDEKTLHENKIMTIQDDFEKQISELKMQQENINTHNEEIMKLQSELIALQTDNSQKDAIIEGLKAKFVEMETNMNEMLNHITLKDNEIFEKTRDFTIALTQRNEQFETVRLQLIDYEKKLEELAHDKESELANMRLKLHDNSNYYDDKIKEYENEKADLTQMLQTKIEEVSNLNKELYELKTHLQENADKMNEMQSALETQEYEIVTLKDEIDNMQEIMTSNKIEKRVTFAADVKPADQASDVTEELPEAVPKAELDLALYMLHQRDVRCEELTMELTQLLEERDTLQLRLSDSLRSYEDLKMRSKLAGFDIMSMSSQETIPEIASVSGEKEQQFVDVHKSPTSRSSSVSENDPDKPRLQAKLTELRSVKHSRDFRLRNESEQREMSMRLLQRDVANLPPEAAEQLRQAHHTLLSLPQSQNSVDGNASVMNEAEYLASSLQKSSVL